MPLRFLVAIHSMIIRPIYSHAMSDIPKALHLRRRVYRGGCPERRANGIVVPGVGSPAIRAASDPGVASSWLALCVGEFGGGRRWCLRITRRVETRAIFLVIDSECASGWVDRRRGVGLVGVIWRTGPCCQECIVAPGTYRQWSIGTKAVAEAGTISCVMPAGSGAARMSDEPGDQAIAPGGGFGCGAVDAAEVRSRPSRRCGWNWRCVDGAEPGRTESHECAVRVSADFPGDAGAGCFKRQHGESPAIYHHRLKMTRAQEFVEGRSAFGQGDRLVLAINTRTISAGRFRRFAGKRSAGHPKIADNPGLDGSDGAGRRRARLRGAILRFHV